MQSKGGEVIDKSEDYFSIKYPNAIAEKQFTYQPVVAREKNIPLISTGSPDLQKIFNECLESGVLSQIKINATQPIDLVLNDLFKDAPYVCQDCDRVIIGTVETGVCTKKPRCYHRINNAKKVSLKIVKQEDVRFFQFYFTIQFQNKLRPKTEELIMVSIDIDGNIISSGDFHEHNPLDKLQLNIEDDDEPIEQSTFDRLKLLVDEKIDAIIKAKLDFYDLTLKNEIRNRLRSFDKRLKAERREKLISKTRDFDERKWQANYKALYEKERDSYRTHITVKFVNVLAVKTKKVIFQVLLTNGSIINSTFTLGLSSEPGVLCSNCNNAISEGYATEDSMYLCLDCIRQSIETGNIFGKSENLTVDSILGEFMEADEGFICSVCHKRYSRLLEFKCNHDNSSICLNDFDRCDICGKDFSIKNIRFSKETGKKICPKHSTKCHNCASVIGIDEGKICKATGHIYCSCVPFYKCASCEQEYSTTALVNNKCPACTNLSASSDQSLINCVIMSDVSQRKTSKWLIGKNALNSIVIAKRMFSDTLYVVEKNSIRYKKSISFVNKLRGR